MNDRDIEALATALVTARTNRASSGVAATLGAGLTEADAYRVQELVRAKIGAGIAGWKVGTPNATAVPSCAPIFAGTIYASNEPITCEPSTGVELEIAFKLGRDFPRGSAKPSRAVVEDAVQSAHVVIELCASRLADGLKAPPLLNLADCIANLGLVVGPEIKNWRGIEAARQLATVEADGQRIANTTGGHSTGDLIGLLTWLIGHCVSERDGIAAGSIVTTGSWTGINWVDTPVRVGGRFDGLGAIQIQLVK